MGLQAVFTAALVALAASCATLSEQGMTWTGEPPATASSPTPAPAAATSTVPTATAAVLVSGTTFRVEVAADSTSRAKGLSGRDQLPADSGMLFVMAGEGTPNFWMPDMLFPLDMIWIGPDCYVVGIEHDVPAPEPGTPTGDLPTYSSPEPVSFVLEVNAGQARRLGIEPGDLVSFTNIEAPDAQRCS